ncbi:MAG: glycosyltransferase family 39 protein [Caulobacteraceae bacterium]
MSLALPAGGRPTWIRAGRFAASGWGWDALSLGGLVLFAWAILIWRFDAMPLQLWDESRNANNALEVALGGHWLAPTFGGLPDHWNTKPPLLIWLMAMGFKLGLPPLVAIRLPSWIAAFGVLGMLWGTLRLGLKDRTAAILAGALLLGSLSYVAPHAARTGDFDALESLFVTGYVLCGWAALEGERRRVSWLAATAGFAVLAVMTKGVAGLLAAPGLAVLALFRWKALVAVLKDGRAWLLAIGAVSLCAGYYLVREHFDPGYIRVVLANEIGGRFTTVSDNHRGGPDFYFNVLEVGFEPGLALLATVVATFFGRDPRRRSLALGCLLSGLSLLLVLSAAKSKLDWYATPMIPLFSVAAAVGTADLLAWIGRRSPPWGRDAARVVVGAVLAATLGFALVASQTARTSTHGDLDGPQFDYARLFARIEAARPARSIIAVDDGFYNDAGFRAYNPILKFYALREASRGLKVDVRGSDADLPDGSDVATCDPAALGELKEDYSLTPRLREGACTLVHVNGPVG